MKPRWPSHMRPREVGLWLVAMGQHDYKRTRELWDAWTAEAYEPILRLGVRELGLDKPKRRKR